VNRIVSGLLVGLAIACAAVLLSGLAVALEVAMWRAVLDGR